MLEFLLPLLYILAASALYRLIGGILQGMTGRGPDGRTAAPPAVRMVRDPVCGTFVVPDQAIAISDGRTQVYFCSADCRDKYRAKSA
jgi:YHS domain-containing protein